MTEKKKLPLIDKSLMPEVLPPPPVRSAGMLGPRERVRARLRQIAEIAAAASLSAACGTAQTGPQKMHTLTPSSAGGGGVVAGGRSAPAAGSGAGGAAVVQAGVSGMAAGSGAAGQAGGPSPWGAGYGVVDPMPPPALCPDPGGIALEIADAHWSALSVTATLMLRSAAGQFQTPYLQSATASAPVSVTIQNGGTSIKLQTSGVWPASVDVVLHYACASVSGSGVYETTVRFDTSQPGSGSVPSRVLSEELDAGL